MEAVGRLQGVLVTSLPESCSYALHPLTMVVQEWAKHPHYAILDWHAINDHHK